MWNWMRRWRTPATPTVNQTTIGEVQIDSGTMLLTDMNCMNSRVLIDDLPPGRYPVHAQIIRYPEGSQRIAKIGVSLRNGTPQSQRELGIVDVDSATVMAVDNRAFEHFWEDIGTTRIGRLGTPQHRKIARVIEKQFGLKSRPVNPVVSEIDESISEELESRITTYLQSFTEYADHTFMYFHVQTMNTFDRIQEAMQNERWAEVRLSETNPASLLAFESGFGDGSYPVVGMYCSELLVRLEIEFIGPIQDKILEAFPVLRYE